MEQGSSEVLKTGLRPEDQEVGVEGRDAVRELQEDLIIHLALISYVCERLESVRDTAEQEELHDVINTALEGLSKFEQKFSSIDTQTELFPESPVTGRSVKLEQFKKLQDQFRDWWNLASGVKSILSRVTHEFEDVADFGRTVAAETEEEKRQFYSRGWSEEVFKREKGFADMVHAPDAALFNSGMSAIETILEDENLAEGDAIVVAENFYYHTGLLIRELEKQGIEVVRVPSGDTEAIQFAIRENQPRLVLAEVISNTPQMEVFPVREVLQFLSDHQKGQETRLVLDNTFLTPELLDVLEEAKKIQGGEHIRLAVIESATKYYQQGLDNVTAGLVYSNDETYVQSLKERRAMIGTHMQEQLANYLPPQDARALETKMLRHSSNAMLLAQMLEDVETVEVSHPSLETHPDHERSGELVQGAGGLFYIEWKGEVTAEEIVNEIKRVADERGVDIKIGVSFGHPQTWIETIRLPNTPEDDPQHIRISVGSENIAEFKEVMEVFRDVL